MLMRLTNGIDDRLEMQLNRLKNRLVNLAEKPVVKINHSVMELVCAKHLLLNGFDVSVEHPLTETLVCDVYATKGNSTLILEVETGFIPPQNALHPLTSWSAKLVGQVAKYSVYSNQFGLATPPHHLLQIPPIFLKHPKERSRGELLEIKDIYDKFYNARASTTHPK